jgi:hypothetical protein
MAPEWLGFKHCSALQLSVRMQPSTLILGHDGQAGDDTGRFDMEIYRRNAL